MLGIPHVKLMIVNCLGHRARDFSEAGKPMNKNVALHPGLISFIVVIALDLLMKVSISFKMKKTETFSNMQQSQ